MAADPVPAEELEGLQDQVPPHPYREIERTLTRSLGRRPDEVFVRFEPGPIAAASLGQVHRAVSLDGYDLACKLQYADMQSAVEADLKQLGVLFAIRRRFDPAIDTTEIIKEIGARVREGEAFDVDVTDTDRGPHLRVVAVGGDGAPRAVAAVKGTTIIGGIANAFAPDTRGLLTFGGVAAGNGKSRIAIALH